MKKIFTTEFKVGLTVIFSTLVLILGIIWGKGFRLQTNKYQLQVVFDNVGGMVPGDPVTVNGVKEGKVLKIGWKGRKVLCTIQLNNDVVLYEDATFTVVSAELLAGMKIEIFPGKSNNHLNLSEQPFEGKYGGRIVDVGIVIGELAEDMSKLSFRVDSTVSMINTFLKKGEIQQNVTSSLNNLNKITAGLATLPHSMNKTMTVLDSTVNQLHYLVKNNDREMESTLTNLNTISIQLDSATVSLNHILGSIEKDKGTLGRMVSDSTMDLNVNRTLMRIDSLARQIKEEGLQLDLF